MPPSIEPSLPPTLAMSILIFSNSRTISPSLVTRLGCILDIGSRRGSSSLCSALYLSSFPFASFLRCSSSTNCSLSSAYLLAGQSLPFFYVSLGFFIAHRSNSSASSSSSGSSTSSGQTSGNARPDRSDRKSRPFSKASPKSSFLPGSVSAQYRASIDSAT
jgi:hypothetical protein